MSFNPFAFRPRQPTGPRSHRAYAIGDIHGRLDVLQMLLGMIQDDVHKRGSKRTSIIFSATSSTVNPIRPASSNFYVPSGLAM